MSDDVLMTQVKAFIAEHVDSVVQLEVLLRFHDAPEKTWTSADIAEAFRIDLAWVATQMSELQARGFLAQQEGAMPRYQYAPRTPQLHESVEQVAQAYAERRVSIINMIYSKPIDKLRNFSEAFRFRKGDSDG